MQCCLSYSSARPEAVSTSPHPCIEERKHSSTIAVHTNDTCRVGVHSLYPCIGVIIVLDEYFWSASA